ncbi:MAG TPA: sugar-binding protein, partial [Gemmataceae bacterium]|nr:sugar-binding protein [Gemmataceae bacterium]
SVPSSPCKTPPTIDGVIAADEWKDAKVVAFDLEMASLDPATKSTRACELRVMNSANALYVAFRVPDETVNARLNPIDLDVAILAFCRGEKLRTGDDRKVIAPGLYADKHFVEPNKDADDRQKDGRGAVGHEKGVYTFEWAIPLNSGDPEDLQARPGDSVRFNLAYFDGFRAELKDTKVGGVYGAELNKADAWGTIELAAKVEDDGGAAFRGPAWVADLFKILKPPANRLKLTESSLVSVWPRPVVKGLVSFTYRAPEGKEKEGKAAIYLPGTIRDDPKVRIPLYFNAGYEADDNSAAAMVRRGFVVVSPRALEANPLIRTTNPDIALLHSVRAFPFVDDGRVVIGGGSAGGYMTLMLAAETFPLAGAAPDVPPVNWGYNAAYFFKQRDRLAPAKGETVSNVPILYAVGGLIGSASKVYGEDYGDATWYAHSPVAHVSTITCPVSVNWTTADVLVPIDQVGAKWVKPFDKSKFPDGFTMDPEKLTDTKEGRTRLMDVLKETDYEVFELAVPKGAVRAGVPPAPGGSKSVDLPVSATRQWSIAILDEGRPEPDVGHLKYAVAWKRDKFLDLCKANKIAPAQLTPAKLERLMARYAGKEWLPSPLKHLDDPEIEKADVLRGLRTFVAAGAENAKRFAELYEKLPVERQVLEANVVKELAGGK